MSNDIGYGAAAIRAGDAKYQHSLVDLLKQSADRKPAEKSEDPKPAKPSNEAVGRKVDVQA